MFEPKAQAETPDQRENRDSVPFVVLTKAILSSVVRLVPTIVAMSPLAPRNQEQRSNLNVNCRSSVCSLRLYDLILSYSLEQPLQKFLPVTQCRSLTAIAAAEGEGTLAAGLHRGVVQAARTTDVEVPEKKNR